MKPNVAKGMIIAIVLVLVITTLVPYLHDAENRSKEIVEIELLTCVVAACISDKTIGNECIVVKPRVSKIRITVDQNGYRRVQILPTDVDCSQPSPQP